MPDPDPFVVRLSDFWHFLTLEANKKLRRTTNGSGSGIAYHSNETKQIGEQRKAKATEDD